MKSLLPNEFQTIGHESGNVPFLFAGLLIEDWNAELTPWPAAPVFGNKSFEGRAKETLNFVERCLVPDLKTRFGLDERTVFIIGGHSLGGLFALWTSTQTDLFKGVAAASPSVWYPQWDDFSARNRVHAQCVYLSLGNREPLTKNLVMSQSGSNIEKLHKRVSDWLGGDNSILFWNEGNHFSFPEIRTGKAFAWVLNKLQEKKTPSVPRRVQG